MPSKPAKPNRKTITVRIDATLVMEARNFVRDYAGKPLFLTLNGLTEAAIRNEIDRCRMILSGALPLDRVSGTGDGEADDPDPPSAISNRRINASTRT